MAEPLLRGGFAEADLAIPPGSSRGSWGIFCVVPTASAAPLKVRASVLDDGRTRVFIVSIDAVIVEAAVGAPCRAEIGRRCGVPPENVILQYTHTHQGPYYNAFPDAMAQAMIESAAACAAQAAADLQPVTLHWASAETSGLNINRRRRAQPVDKTLSLLRFDGAEGPRAAWFYFTAHPLCAMGYDDRWSADFPGYAIQNIQSRHPRLHAQFLQGAAGDVSPLDWWFDNAAPEHPGHDDTARLMGARLSAAVEAIFEKAARLDAAPLRLLHRRIDIPHRKFWFAENDLKRLIAELAPRLEQNPPRPWGSRLHVSTVAQSEPEVYMLTGARYLLTLWPNQGKMLDCELQALRIGEVSLITIPGELFSAPAAEIRAACGPKTLVAGYCNAGLGYLPARADMEELEGLPFREWIDQVKYRWAYGATITTMVDASASERIVDAVRAMR